MEGRCARISSVWWGWTQGLDTELVNYFQRIFIPSVFAVLEQLELFVNLGQIQPVALPL